MITIDTDNINASIKTVRMMVKKVYGFDLAIQTRHRAIGYQTYQTLYSLTGENFLSGRNIIQVLANALAAQTGEQVEVIFNTIRRTNIISE